jgi:tRNA threonylcarbamoyladenosine biosynthesis protein TsaE
VSGPDADAGAGPLPDTGAGTGPLPDTDGVPRTDPSRLVLHSGGADQTRLLAGALARLCAPGDVLLLVGDLGAGKTTFAQGFGAGLGVPDPVTSPTFTLVRQYPVPPPASGTGHGGGPVRSLVHADLYRLDHLHEIVDLGLGELVEDGAVALVEWGEAAGPVLGDRALFVELVAGEEESERVITVSPSGPTWSERWPALERALVPWRTDG